MDSGARSVLLMGSALGALAGGGLAVLWKEDLDVRLETPDKMHIDVTILDSVTKVEKWRFTGFYGESKHIKIDQLHIIITFIMSTKYYYVFH